MNIVKSTSVDAPGFALSGRFTFDDHKKFRELIESIHSISSDHMNLYMAELNYVDSAALGMLMLALDEAKKYGKHIVLRGTLGDVDKIFRMACFHELFDMAK